MKRAPLTLFGAIVSFLVAAAIQPAGAGDSRSAHIRGQLSPQTDAHEETRSTVEVPRGDLRRDISNNVRSHPDAPREGADNQSREKSRPDSR
jgi:hypothetical protein